MPQKVADGFQEERPRGIPLYKGQNEVLTATQPPMFRHMALVSMWRSHLSRSHPSHPSRPERLRRGGPRAATSVPGPWPVQVSNGTNRAQLGGTCAPAPDIQDISDLEGGLDSLTGSWNWMTLMDPG